MMTPDERSKYVRVQILQTLDQCGGYLLKESTLFTQINIELRPVASTTELSSALGGLSALRAINSVRSDLGGDLQWKITAQGRAILAENV